VRLRTQFRLDRVQERLEIVAGRRQAAGVNADWRVSGRSPRSAWAPPAMRSAFHMIAEAADTTGLPRSRSTTVPTCRAVSPAHENSITSSSPSRRVAHSNAGGNVGS
jgi:hypothetical protein